MLLIYVTNLNTIREVCEVFHCMFKLKIILFNIYWIFELQSWWYSVVVSISGCGPLDPGSNPGTAIFQSIVLNIMVVILT